MSCRRPLVAPNSAANSRRMDRAWRYEKEEKISWCETQNKPGKVTDKQGSNSKVNRMMTNKWRIDRRQGFFCHAQVLGDGWMMSSPHFSVSSLDPCSACCSITASRSETAQLPPLTPTAMFGCLSTLPPSDEDRPTKHISSV